MGRLDDLVAEHLETRLLDPERLKEVLGVLLERRQERSERRATQVAQLRKKAAEADGRLKRLYEAIESGIADLSDVSVKTRIDELRALKSQAQVDADRASVAVTGSAQITPAKLLAFAEAARERLRGPNGGYRRDHLRALAQRVEVGDGEVRIMGSRSELLRTLAAGGGVVSAAGGVPSFVPKWRRGWDSNPRCP